MKEALMFTYVAPHPDKVEFYVSRPLADVSEGIIFVLLLSHLLPL